MIESYENNLALNVDELSIVLIRLMKGVIYLDDDPKLWQHLLNLQVKVRDYVRVIGLDLLLNEEEGVAWLSSRSFDEGELELPRLIQKRQLSYPVSLLLAILRRRLVEHDASSGESRLIISQDDLIEQARTFLPIGSNEAKFMDQMNTHINKIIELGFIRRLKNNHQQLEIRRIIKAFIDAQWLGEFESQMQQYIEYGNTLRENEK